MNIKQAKTRFTELTGLPATRNNFYLAIREQGGNPRQWVKFRWQIHNGNAPKRDYRCTHVWVNIVAYLELLQEVV